MSIKLTTIKNYTEDLNKQIEEMAKAIYNLDHCEGYKDDRGCMYAPTCSVCKHGRENKSKQISELLAKQGYRKADEVARQVIADMREMIKGYENIDVYLDRIEKKYTEGEG